MSSGSESDEDYVPEEPEQLSEEESANEETEQQYENEESQKAKKRKAVEETKGKKKARTINGVVDAPTSEKPEDSSEVTKMPEEEKKREEDLWAKFLEGTDTKPKSTNYVCNKKDEVETISKSNKVNNHKDLKAENEDIKSKETRIFEFAGEKIVVENNIIKEKLKTDSALPGPKQEPITSRKTPGSSGISNILGQIGKKGKLSTLEKSKLDWTTFKKQEGIEEEIQNHNKGKQGYLDRRDFLERADVRQYEIERDLRLTRRSNR